MQTYDYSETLFYFLTKMPETTLNIAVYES
jgi:hypothetical protein